MTALSAFELKLRGIFYRIPLPVYTALVGLAIAFAMVALFGALEMTEGSMSDDDGFPVFPVVLASVLGTFFIWWEERKQRAANPDASRRLAFDRVVLDPSSREEGEPLPQEWRKELRDLADSKAVGFMPLIIMAPMVLLIIFIPATNGDAIWPSIVFVIVLFALVAIGGVLGIRRGRNAELVLGRSGAESVP